MLQIIYKCLELTCNNLGYKLYIPEAQVRGWSRMQSEPDLRDCCELSHKSTSPLGRFS